MSQIKISSQICCFTFHFISAFVCCTICPGSGSKQLGTAKEKHEGGLTSFTFNSLSHGGWDIHALPLSFQTSGNFTPSLQNDNVTNSSLQEHLLIRMLSPGIIEFPTQMSFLIITLIFLLTGTMHIYRL